MKRIFTLNKMDLTKEEQEKVNHYYKGLRALRDTITEEVINEKTGEKRSTTYFIFVGSWTPYGSCVKHGDRYVFARYSRWDSITTDFTDFAIDCDENGQDSKWFETHHFEVNNNQVEY